MKTRMAIALLAIVFAENAVGESLAERVHGIVEKMREETTPRAEVKKLVDNFREQNPDSDEASLLDAVYLSYLMTRADPSPLPEMKSVFQSLRKRGESKAFVVMARAYLVIAYTYEFKTIEARTLAQEGLNLVDRVAAKQSYDGLMLLMKECYGGDVVRGAETDVTEWMKTLETASKASD